MRCLGREEPVVRGAPLPSWCGAVEAGASQRAVGSKDFVTAGNSNSVQHLHIGIRHVYSYKLHPKELLEHITCDTPIHSSTIPCNWRE